MTTILNKSILLLCCVGYAISQSDASYVVLPMLVVIILVALTTVLKKPLLNLILLLSYIIACCFYPILLYFLPIVCYEVFFTQYQFAVGFICIPLIIQYQTVNGTTLIIIIILCMLSYILKHNAYKLKVFQDNYVKLRDETAGMADILEKKNKDLLEKQDYEVNLATLNERNRIAREIHDNVGHMLSRSILQVGALIAITKDVTTKETLGNIKNSLTEGMDSIRNSIHNIHEDSIDLKTKLNALIHEFNFCSIYFDYNITNDFTTKAKYSILYIVKEALNNVMKHSNATRVTVSIMEHQNLYQIVIADNGTIPTSNTSTSSMGINSMHERIESINGTMHIDKGKGYQIYISIPKEGIYK